MSSLKTGLLDDCNRLCRSKTSYPRSSFQFGMQHFSKGAQASTIVYSIVETAKANNLKPYEYLQRLRSVMMEHIYDADTAYLGDLMPWSKNLPEICRKAT